METAIVILLFIICIELGLILYDIRDVIDRDEEPKSASNPRRELNGTFRNGLGDGYRKNQKGQYVPIHPNSRMLDGSDEDDEV